MTQNYHKSRYPDPKDWVVSRHRHDLRRVVIQRSEGVPLSAWIARLKRHLARIQDRRPADLLAEVRRSGVIDLGILAGREARRIGERLRGQGFDVRVEDASFTSYLPMVAGAALLIEDAKEAEAFCLELIEGGARVEEIEG